MTMCYRLIPFYRRKLNGTGGHVRNRSIKKGYVTLPENQTMIKST